MCIWSLKLHFLNLDNMWICVSKILNFWAHVGGQNILGKLNIQCEKYVTQMKLISSNLQISGNINHRQAKRHPTFFITKLLSRFIIYFCINRQQEQTKQTINPTKCNKQKIILQKKTFAQKEEDKCNEC